MNLTGELNRSQLPYAYHLKTLKESSSETGGGIPALQVLVLKGKEDGSSNGKYVGNRTVSFGSFFEFGVN